MKPALSLHEVTLGEWASHAIVLPARKPEDAVIVARMLHGLFDVAPFRELPRDLPVPGAPRASPALHEPDRLVGYLAELYHRMTLAGPDRRVFAREFDIVEDQIQHLRAAGHGNHHPSLRIHDRLVAARHQPPQILAASWLRHAPANPPEEAPRLRKQHIARFRAFAAAAIGASRKATKPDNQPSKPQTPPDLQKEWRALKNEHTHAVVTPPAEPTRPALTARTYFDRLAERARSSKPPGPAHEQDNEPEPSA